MDHEEDGDSLEYLKRLDDFFDGKVQQTAYLELEKRGQAPPQPEKLSDGEISQALTELVWGLADLGVQIDDADHLPDRELYIRLLEFCDEPSVFFPGMKNATYHWSPIGACTEEDNVNYLRYYADESTRQQWAKDFKMELPERETPAYPRPWMPQRQQ